MSVRRQGLHLNTFSLHARWLGSRADRLPGTKPKGENAVDIIWWVIQFFEVEQETGTGT
jgi:hypothetical protein